MVVLDELQFYGSLPAYTHLTVKDATCMATGIKRDCYRRNSDGKYFADNTGTTELAESDVIAPIISHSGEHHEATDTNREYWQCSMCGKLFSDENCTTEITEEQTKIYRTITIDGSISSLVTSNVSQALAGTTMYLYVSDLIDASTLKVNNGAVEVTHGTGDWYNFTMPATDVTVTAEVAQSNVDGDTLTGSIRHTVTIVDGASITLNNAAISGSIVCKGSATITLVCTNSVSGATDKAGIQIGGSGTTLTIKGDGSLTANGGDQSAGIGLSRAWKPANDVIGGDIVIEDGTITAIGGRWGAGIGTGVIYGNGSAKTARIGNIIIKGGTVKVTGGTSADGIGTGYTYSPCTNAIGTVTIYDGIDKVDASSIKNFGSVVYMHGETDITASASDYFTISENGDRRIIVPKDDTDYTINIADDIEHGTIAFAAETAKYGDKVTITATPDFGYRLSRLVVKDAENNDVASTGNTFLMPKGNVTVSAVFEQGTHGTTEFKLRYLTGSQQEHYESIYDGVTTVNLQQGQLYKIFKYDNEYGYRKFLLDNDTYDATIPYSGGTGTFLVDGNGTNFSVDNNSESGFYDITMTDVGNGKWSASILKTVGAMDNIPDRTYTGSEIKPEPQVMAGSLSLTKGTDYEYSYTNNTNVGTAKVIVTFKGDYASLGTVEKEFKIVKATPIVTAPTVNMLTYNGGEQELVTAGSTDFGKVLYSLNDETYSEEIPKGTVAKTYTVYYKVEGSNNWNVVEPQSLEVIIADSYTVTWKNDDKTIETDLYVPAGTMPSYNGETPTKAGDTNGRYVFKGWNTDISEVTEDVTYTAQYTYYTYAAKTFKLIDGKSHIGYCIDTERNELYLIYLVDETAAANIANYDYVAIVDGNGNIIKPVKDGANGAYNSTLDGGSDGKIHTVYGSVRFPDGSTIMATEKNAKYLVAFEIEGKTELPTTTFDIVMRK